MPDRIVELATLVYARAAFKAQFATNHKKQNPSAILAVSFTVSGLSAWSIGGISST
jgi:hypothetical protein